MINYDKFWTTLEQKGITKYSLIYHYNISSNTLRRMAKNEPITTSTINEFCMILECEPSDIISFELLDDEKIYIEDKRSNIKKKS